MYKKYFQDNSFFFFFTFFFGFYKVSLVFITLSIPHVPAGFIFESNAQLRYSVLNDCFIAGVEVNVIYDVGEWRRNRLEHPALTSLYLFVCVIFCRNSSSFF